MHSTTLTQPTLNQDLPDTQSLHDGRGLAIQNAGISGLQLPATLIDIDGSHTTGAAEYSISVAVQPHQKGTHMSRLVEFAQQTASTIYLEDVTALMPRLLDLMQAESGTAEIRIPWFVERQAPRSQRRSQLNLEFCLRLVQENLQAPGRITYRLRVPVTTLCPCSKAISAYGAHNQRSIVAVEIELYELHSIDILTGLIESQASCPVYTVLKREDEKHVTEQAYDNPKFAEDIVRDVTLSLIEHCKPKKLHVSTTNHESIHNHAAFAELHWPQ
jgi:GTP cyclohydrolase FolE2